MTQTVSILGLGPRGTWAARQLLAAATLDLTVFDRDGARCELFRGQATLASSASEALRESGIIVLALKDSREVDRVLKRYSDGAITLDLHAKTLVDLCVRPDAWAAALAQAIARAGGQYLAAPADMAALQRLIDAAPSAQSC